MKKLYLLLAIIIGFYTTSYAQLGKTMSQYHGEKGITVTQLDKNLYGLYKKKSISPEIEELLKQLEEVYILNVDLKANPQKGEEIKNKIKSIVEKSNNYKLVKSSNNNELLQMIYTKSAKDDITDLVVYQETKNNQLDVIELKGKIELENIAGLSRALNIRGLNSLSMLTPQNETYRQLRRSHDFEDIAEQMRKMGEEFQNRFSDFDFSFDFGDLDKMFDSLGMGFDRMGRSFGHMGDMFERMSESFNFDGMDMISNSVQITEENGKTKIKINAENSDMVYVIDGVEIQGDEIQMPESIRTTRIITDKNNSRKSYLVVNSTNKLGNFISYKDGILTFEYNDQNYTFNLVKADEPLLSVNGKLTNDFERINPSRIIQIRPVSEIEKELGVNKGAQVIILTK